MHTVQKTQECNVQDVTLVVFMAVLFFSQIKFLFYFDYKSYLYSSNMLNVLHWLPVDRL